MHPARLAAIAVCSLLPAGLPAASFIWNNVPGIWSDPVAWQGNAAPPGTNAADVLIFGGDVGTAAGTPPNYTSTNDGAAPFLLSGLTLAATDAAGLSTDPAQVIAGGALHFASGSAGLTQSGAGAFTLTTPIEIAGVWPLGGDGTGSVTLNRGVSGFADIVKGGASVYRFGTFPPPPVPPATTSTAPSENTWMGRLVITNGVMRFNNNADSGRTALRANGVVLTAGAALVCSSELRTGTLAGAGGVVQSQVTGTNSNTEDIIVDALSDGTFAGTVQLGAPTGTGTSAGVLALRGPGVQTLTGQLLIDKDVSAAGTLVLDGTGSLGAQTKGAIIMSGGTLRLENATTNNNNRLRDASATSTGFDVIGGGLVQLSGNAGGTTETAGRLQLCSLTVAGANKPRSGELGFQVIHRAAAAPTVLTLQSYTRDATVTRAHNTVQFSALNAAGTAIALATAGSNPRIVFTTAPTLSNALLSSSGGTASVGWATVMAADGLAFATHSAANGIAAVTTTTLNAASSSTSANSQLTANASVTLGTYAQNSVRLKPATAGLTLTLSAATTLNCTAIVLAGANNFTITGGTLGGSGPRFLQVERAALTVASGLANAQPLIKGGTGTLILTNANNNTASLQPVAINAGTLRAVPGTTLPGGELNFRGGVLEITGGGTFARPFVTGPDPGSPGAGTVNWSGLSLDTTVTPNVLSTIAEERASGGFAAVGADASVDLGLAGVSDVRWEQKGFVQSGFALILGSAAADRRITLVDNLSVSSGENTINYNAREIRVPDNTTVTTDRARLTGVVTGTIHNDLLKTGAGTLELAGVNTMEGAAIVHAGTLVVSGSLSAAIATDVLSGATLAGTGAVSAILLESGARLAPGDATVATLTGTGLVWRAGATARFDLGTGGNADRIALGGGFLSKGGSSGAFTFDFGGGGATGFNYTLATFGSTDFAAADFTAANVAPGVTGHFVISGGNTLSWSTQNLTPLETWRQAWFGPGATDSGSAANLADPDGDSFSNLTEYVLNRNPLTIGNPDPALTLTPAQDILTFTRNRDATDAAIRVEASTTLAPGSWTVIASRPAGAAAWTSIPGVTVTENAAGLVTLTSARELRRFLRITAAAP